MPADPNQIGQLLGMLAGVVEGGGGGRVWQQFRRWTASLARAAALKWPVAVAAGARCQCPGPVGAVRDCNETAVCVCSVCGAPACLGHAFVDDQATAVCRACIADLRKHHGEWKRHAPAPGARPRSVVDEMFEEMFGGVPKPRRRPVDHEVIAAYTELGLEMGVPMSQVHGRFKELVLELHPDLEPDPVKKHQKQERLREVVAAYNVLKARAAKKSEART